MPSETCLIRMLRDEAGDQQAGRRQGRWWPTGWGESGWVRVCVECVGQPGCRCQPVHTTAAARATQLDLLEAEDGWCWVCVVQAAADTPQLQGEHSPWLLLALAP